MRFDLTYRAFGVDQVDGRDVFEEGDQLELRVGAEDIGDRLHLRGTLRTLLKGDNTTRDPADSTVFNVRANSGSAVFLRLTGDVPWRQRFRVGLEGEFNLVGRSDSFGRNGVAFGLGPTFELPIGANASGRLRAAYAIGSLEGPPGRGSLGLSGFMLSFGLGWVPAP
jgi:hypothetical protein